MLVGKTSILFDLDGVLIDSRANMRHAWSRVRSELGVAATFEEYFAVIGRPMAGNLEALGLTARADEIIDVYKAASLANLAMVRPFAEVPRVLDALAESGLRLGVVTSKDPTRTHAMMACLPDVFEVVVAPDGSMPGKPAPDPLLAAVAAMDITVDDAVYVGDMAHDYEAARAAGMDYLHVGWGFSPPPQGVRVLTSMSELEDAR